ncbi:MAG TPA: hypothetical protein VK391_05250 [Allosphingosinicella sp.]|nr:hypothetical protein [Allosphingosinicella sp.]
MEDADGHGSYIRDPSSSFQQKLETFVGSSYALAVAEPADERAEIMTKDFERRLGARRDQALSWSASLDPLTNVLSFASQGGHR